MRVAIYARVSTEKGQDEEVQIDKLREYCKIKDWQVAKIYREQISGTKEDREEFKKLMDDARRREFDIVLVWKFDRFTREGAFAALDYTKRLYDSGVGFKSMTEEFLDTTGSFGKQVLMPLVAWMAQQESIKISERVKAGIERKKEKGKYYDGKPSYNLSEKIVEHIKSLRKQGFSFRRIQKELEGDGIKLSLGYVHKIVR